MTQSAFNVRAKMATLEMVSFVGKFSTSFSPTLVDSINLILQLKNSESDKDECVTKTHDCQGGILCTNTVGSFKCETIDLGGECMQGWQLNFSTDPDAGNYFSGKTAEKLQIQMKLRVWTLMSVMLIQLAIKA